MPRHPRIDYAGAWHHVMHRGARRAAIFRSDGHCGLFLALLGEAAERFGVEVHAYALMPNHYHLLLRSGQPNLSRCMARLNARYTQQLNRMLRWDGALLRGRFRSQLVRDGAALPYLLSYIHLNPLRAGLVTKLDAPAWTSHRAYLGRERAPEWLCRDFFLRLLKGPSGLHRHVLSLHQGSAEWPERMSRENGWYGPPSAVEIQPMPAVDKPSRPSVQHVLERVCAVTGASPGELRRVRRGPHANPARRFAVWALDRQTELKHREIGALLGMSTTQVANVLWRWPASREAMEDWIRAWGLVNEK